MSQNNPESNVKSSEKPPSLNYGVRFGDASELVEITERLRGMGRQTMNMRTMEKTSALILTDADRDHQMIGWQGFNFENPHRLPEKFSLHLDPAYRSFLLGLVLETALYAHAVENNLPFLILRMNKLETQSLLDYRMNSGIFSRVDSSEMPATWIQMCQKCELYGRSCREQEFFKIDVQKGAEFGMKRLGRFDMGHFPLQVTLIENQIRGFNGNVRFIAKIAA